MKSGLLGAAVPSQSSAAGPGLALCALPRWTHPWGERPRGLWDSPGRNAGVGSLSCFQGIFPTQGSNPGVRHCRWSLYRSNCPVASSRHPRGLGPPVPWTGLRQQQIRGHAWADRVKDPGVGALSPHPVGLLASGAVALPSTWLHGLQGGLGTVPSCLVCLGAANSGFQKQALLHPGANSRTDSPSNSQRARPPKWSMGTGGTGGTTGKLQSQPTGRGVEPQEGGDPSRVERAGPCFSWHPAALCHLEQDRGNSRGRRGPEAGGGKETLCGKNRASPEAARLPTSGMAALSPFWGAAGEVVTIGSPCPDT